MSPTPVSSPSQIFADIDAQPPLMRQDMIGRYAGVRVDWEVIFRNAREEDAGRAWLAFQFDPHSIRMIVGEALLSDYPQLRFLHAGEPVRIGGLIRRIDSLTIELEIQELLFPQVHERAHAA